MLMMVLKRMLIAVPSLIGVVIVTFLLTRALPGDPAAYFAGPAATKEAIEQIRVKLGLDKPLYLQFIRYIGDLARGSSPTGLSWPLFFPGLFSFSSFNIRPAGAPALVGLLNFFFAPPPQVT